MTHLNDNLRLCSSRTDFIRENKQNNEMDRNEQDFIRTVLACLVACIWGEAAVVLPWQNIISWIFHEMILLCWTWLASADMDSCVQPIKRHVPPTRLETSVNPGRNKLCVWNVKDGYCCCASDGQHHLPASWTQACYVHLKSFYHNFHAENNWLIKINSIHKTQMKSF